MQLINDERVLCDFTMAAFDEETCARYRQRFSIIHKGHEWSYLPMEIFLVKIGALKRWEKQLAPTAAGLLLFGREQEITKVYPGFVLDYREWSENIYNCERIISGTGDWSGNLCDFYFCVCDRITADLTDAHGNSAAEKPLLKQSLTNAVINADYMSGNGLIIEKSDSGVIMTNAGATGSNIALAEMLSLVQFI